ncbi:MAG: peptide chain release factor 1 [Armatimonadetes bacterium]|nr:MAG: peptide chain release factor 1 [Armatimonadota bacterium]
MDERLAARLTDVEASFEETLVQLADNTILSDQNKYREVSSRHAELKPIVEAFRRYTETSTEVAEARELAANEQDPEMAEYLADTIASGTDELETIEDELQRLLIPKDPDDDKDVIVEVRAAAGGDEAALWAGDLYRMYERFAERSGWAIEPIDLSATGGGGVKEVTFAVKGKGAWSRLKYEAGPHRVQRVPTTESQGRIHTSMGTVAVLPEVEDVDIQINDNDLIVETMRSQGPGGQSVNTTDSAVRITHTPTGIVVSCQDEKSQLQNKIKAMRVLRARLYQIQLEEQQGERAAARKSQVGSGDRSEKIRTYNFKENRVTDHRIGLTIHSLPAVLDGDLDELHEALIADDMARKLSEGE